MGSNQTDFSIAILIANYLAWGHEKILMHKIFLIVCGSGVQIIPLLKNDHQLISYIYADYYADKSCSLGSAAEI